jgi:hypothetical protein
MALFVRDSTIKNSEELFNAHGHLRTSLWKSRGSFREHKRLRPEGICVISMHSPENWRDGPTMWSKTSTSTSLILQVVDPFVDYINLFLHMASKTADYLLEPHRGNPMTSISVLFVRRTVRI